MGVDMYIATEDRQSEPSFCSRDLAYELDHLQGLLGDAGCTLVDHVFWPGEMDDSEIVFSDADALRAQAKAAIAIVGGRSDEDFLNSQAVVESELKDLVAALAAIASRRVCLVVY